VELQQVHPTVKTPAANFTGDVYMTPIYRGTEASRMSVSLVRFTPGARTNWHRHAVGQTLHRVQGFIVTDATITATIATRFTNCPAEPSASSSPTG
jgi:quercetin dioxygenase-like cupin family protein